MSAEKGVRVGEKRVKSGGGAFLKPGRNLTMELASHRKRRMPLYNLECLYSNRRSELWSPKDAAISALSHPPLLG